MKGLNIRYFKESYTGIYNTEHTECRYTEIAPFCAKMYVGKSNKPLFHYKFSSIERLLSYIKTRANNIEIHKKLQNEKRQKAKDLQKDFNVKDVIPLGAIINNSWGYEQTNQYFYQVIGYSGRTRIIIKEVAQNRQYTGHMSGCTIPEKNNFIVDGDEFTLTVKKDESKEGFYICCPAKKHFMYFKIWDGQKEYFSEYA